MAKRWKVILGCCVAVLVASALATFGIDVVWVGQTDLQVVFIVSDAETKKPVPSAVVEFRKDEEGNDFCREECDEARDSFTTDATGRLARHWTGCMCSGRRSWVRNDTFSLRLPGLWVRASAPGYATGKWTYLDDRSYRCAVKREEGFATLEVNIPLRNESRNPTTPVTLAFDRVGTLGIPRNNSLPPQVSSPQHPEMDNRPGIAYQQSTFGRASSVGETRSCLEHSPVSS